MTHDHCKDRSDEMLGSFIGMHKHFAHFRGHRPGYTGRKSTENMCIIRNIKIEKKKQNHIPTISVKQLLALTVTLFERIQEEQNVSSTKNYLC